MNKKDKTKQQKTTQMSGFLLLYKCREIYL